ncbi:MAG: hypothetical protein QOD10_3596, partial [Mycobacterium sp.]|nr:hypothetical protein [Mycobacterium sp.]
YWLHMWDVNTPIDETMAALDDLVRAGKVRYIGVSDTPAWKIVEANLIARFRGWSSFIGLQVEYSLLERTIEQELVPMASEFGLGITPWSPLKGGVLSGKYTRRNDGQHKADRGALVDSFLNEQTYAVIDELEIIAKAHGASVALAWVHAQPAVASIIIGARRLSQLDDNVHAVDVSLSADELARLDAITKPAFGFPHNMLAMAPGMINGGTSINGVSRPTSEYVMAEGGQPY